METQELYIEIDSFLSEVRNETKTDRINICAWLFPKLCSDSAVAPKVLQHFFESSEIIESSNIIIVDKRISESDAKELKRQYGALVNALLEEMLSQNLPITAFYQKLWHVITSSPSFDGNDKAKIFAVYYIWIDDRIPYFQLESGLQMSDQDFLEISKSLHPKIQKARFILRTSFFSQRSARASVLLDLIESTKNKKERTVLFAHILSFSEPAAIRSEAMKELLSRLIDD